MVEPQPGNKYIVGWISLREGTEAEFDRLAEPFIAACRAEPECRFFEMIRTSEDPLKVFICESFLSEEAHAVHSDRPHAKAFFGEMARLAKVVDVENVIAQRVDPATYNF